MTEFDPYYLWLGIPPEEQPPNHYRLLGIRRFEEHPDVISSAADQRMAHLRTFQVGKHGTLSQKLLNQVASARLCLLSPKKKAAYDAHLRKTVPQGPAPDEDFVLADDVSSTEDVRSVAEVTRGTSAPAPIERLFDDLEAPILKIPTAVPKRLSRGQMIAGAAIGAGGLILLLALVLIGRSRAPEQEPSAPQSVLHGKTKELSDVTPKKRPAQPAKGGDKGRQRPSPSPAADFSSLVMGVTTLTVPRPIPGTMDLDGFWTRIAWSEGGASTGGNPSVVAAARPYEGGRIVALTYTCNVTSDNETSNGNERFGENIIRWLDKDGTKVICLRQGAKSPEHGLIDRLVTGKGYQKRVVAPENILTPPRHYGCGVLVYDSYTKEIPAAELAVIDGFVRKGGGLLLCGNGWSYQSHHGKSLDLFSMNVIGASYGLRFEGGRAESLIQGFYAPPAIAAADPATSPPMVLAAAQKQAAGQLKIPAVVTNCVGMKLVLIPAGEFPMGADQDEIHWATKDAIRRKDNAAQDWIRGEFPRHPVQIRRPFYLGVCEVTQGEYEQVMNANPSAYSAQGAEAAKVAGKRTGRYPVESVSWQDADQFCKALIEFPQERTAGRTYRLPTEAEWEYACRAGSATKWSHGDDEAALNDHAWFSGNSNAMPHPVGQKGANAWGLLDAQGSVWEWCADWYERDYYNTSPGKDPTGPGSGVSHVLRGGAWDSPAGHCRAAFRADLELANRPAARGFRVVMLCPEIKAAAIEKPRYDGPTLLAFRPIPNQTVVAGQPLVVPVALEDADRWPGKVRFSLKPLVPPGAQIAAETGVFTWTPAGNFTPGVYDIMVVVQSADGQQAQRSFSVTVDKPATDAPGVR